MKLKGAEEALTFFQRKVAVPQTFCGGIKDLRKELVLNVKRDGQLGRALAGDQFHINPCFFARLKLITFSGFAPNCDFRYRDRARIRIRLESFAGAIDVARNDLLRWTR